MQRQNIRPLPLSITQSCILLLICRSLSIFLHSTCLIFQDCNDTMTNLIRLSGNQGMAWQHATITVPAQPSAHSFVLQAVRGSGVLSDIAIDDIEYYAGKCKSKSVSGQLLSGA